MNQRTRCALAGEPASAPSQPMLPWRSVERGFLAGGIGLTVVATFWLHAFYILPNHDNVSLLLGAERLIDGGRFYYDVFDPDPPLIFLLLEPSAGLAKLTGVDLYLVFSIWVCLLIMWSTVQASRPLLRLFGARRVAAAFVVMIYAILLCFLPGYQFGQREHLSIILLFPWLLRSALRENGDSEWGNFFPVSTTTLAAVGFLIKPQFVLLPIGMLIARGIEQRSWRVFVGRDVIIFGTVSILYASIVILIFPQWFAVARFAVDTYRFLDRPMALVFASFWPPLAIVLAASVVWEVLRIDEPFRTFLRYLALASALLFICSVAQHKGWDYHNLPALVLMSLILVLLTPAISPSLARMQRLPRIAAVILVMALLSQSIIVTFPWFASNCRSRSTFLVRPFPHTASELARGQSFLAITTWGLDVVFPTVSLINARWSSRTAAQWLVPAIVELSLGNPAERRRAAELRQLWTQQVAEDLDRYRPVAVAVRTADDHSAFEMKRGFDLLQLLSQDESFRRAWAPYHEARVIKDWTFYTRDRR